MKQILSILFLFLIIPNNLNGQSNNSYQQPSDEILALADYSVPPSVNTTRSGEYVIYLYSDTYLSIQDIQEDKLSLAGITVNPKLFMRSPISYIKKIDVQNINNLNIEPINNLPQKPKIANIIVSPNQKRIAFTNTTDEGVELWVADLETKQANRISKAEINACFDFPYNWFADSQSVLARIRTKNADTISAYSTNAIGPKVSESEKGKQNNGRIQKNLLNNLSDYNQFDALTKSVLYKIDLMGNKTIWLDEANYIDEVFSPDGKYVLIKKLEKPFSSITPYIRFANVSEIYNAEGELITVIHERKAIEFLPKGLMAVEEGRRKIGWRLDKPSTIYWIEAQDKGDPSIDIEHRDKIFELEAPFNGTPRYLTNVKDRFSKIVWGNEENAIYYSYSRVTQKLNIILFNPKSTKIKAVLSDNNYNDIYNDIGSPDLKLNDYNKAVINIKNNNLYLVGEGISDEGNTPFVDEYSIRSGKKKRILSLESNDEEIKIISTIDIAKGNYLLSIESATEYPNYYLMKNGEKDNLQQISNFQNPFTSLTNIYKETVRYKRADGINLSGTLYLPEGYDFEAKKKLPLIMWSYPITYKDSSITGQSIMNSKTFPFVYYTSPIYWVKKGYAVFDNVSFPIVSNENDTSGSDTFIEQLTANAEASINILDSMGYIDPKRIAIGGHSFGAFMVANLLTHTDLFCTGIARSGAYNRTLTPFGFQSEERTYWDIPDTYLKLSPYLHVKKMKHPILLIHGEDDKNPGTAPIQSELYFKAIQSQGTPARLVILPKEGHYYNARESVLHMLWEQEQWLDKYLMNCLDY